MKSVFRSIVVRADQWAGRVALEFGAERPALLVFLFHALFRDAKEISLDHVNPQQGVTVEHFSTFVDYFLEHGYSFVGPDEVLSGLDPTRKYALITFDDGYFNNTLALPVLAKYRVPAVFYVSTNHVLQQKCYWWDVVYRERRRRGQPMATVRREIHDLSGGTHVEIERYLHDTFGPTAKDPISDIDRPLREHEFVEFARQPYVVIGNHTTDHGLLPNYSAEGVRQQISEAQEVYARLLGQRPNSIAYPAGRYNQQVVEIAHEEGLQLGITVDLHKNYLPECLDGLNALRLGRFLLYGNERLLRQCETCRSELHLYDRLRRLGRNRR